MSSRAAHLAKIYQHLAEAFGALRKQELPSWIARPGRQWPLYTAVAEIAAVEYRPAYAKAVEQLGGLSSNEHSQVWEQHEQLFRNFGGRTIWLHESHYRDGRVPGPSTFAVKRLYNQVGLQVPGAELADHASVEMAFLAFLSNKEANDRGQAQIWRAARRLFIKNHAGTWLPQVGNALAKSGYPAWRAVGQLLSVSLRCDSKPFAMATTQFAFPTIIESEQCNLCGFCLGVCTANALGIYEDMLTTSLWLKPSVCTGCSKCLDVCPTDAMTFASRKSKDHMVVLRKSARAVCSLCGEPTVSEAELAAVAEQLGEPEWLNYCMKCRAKRVVVG